MLPSEYDWRDLRIYSKTVSYTLREYSEEVFGHIGGVRLSVLIRWRSLSSLKRPPAYGDRVCRTMVGELVEPWLVSLSNHQAGHLVPKWYLRG